MNPIKIISLERLSLFWDNIKAYFNPKLKALDTRITQRVWQGKSSELDAAIAAGLVTEETVIIITDESEQETWILCTNEEVREMFYRTA